MIKVRQKDFNIAIRGKGHHVLRTENICTCTSFAGLNKSKGIGFLIHVDTPGSTSLIREMAKVLKEHTDNFDGFEMQMLTGVDGYLMPSAWITKMLLCWKVKKEFGKLLVPKIGTWKFFPGRFGMIVNVGIDANDEDIGIRKTNTYWWRHHEKEEYVPKRKQR